MRKLTKTQEKQQQELLDKMTEAKDALEAAVGEYNAAMEEAWTLLEEKHGAFQEAIEAANEFRQEINDAQEEYAGERSEKWEETDSGQAYISWKDEWANELEVPEIDKPDEVEMPEVEAIDNFENLSPEPGY